MLKRRRRLVLVFALRQRVVTGAVVALLEAKADIYSSDAYQSTPLDLAIKNGHVNTAGVFRNLGQFESPTKLRPQLRGCHLFVL